MKLAPSDLEEPIIRAILDLTEDVDYIARNNVLKTVKSRLNLEGNLDFDFDAYASKAMNTLKTKGLTSIPKRGYWSLTQEGKQMYADTQSTTLTPEVNPTSPLWAKDSEITRLVTEGLDCFSKQDPEVEACATCPVRQQCGEKTLATFNLVIKRLPKDKPSPQVGGSIDVMLKEDLPIEYKTRVATICSKSGATIPSDMSCWYHKESGGIISDEVYREMEERGEFE